MAENLCRQPTTAKGHRQAVKAHTQSFNNNSNKTIIVTMTKEENNSQPELLQRLTLWKNLHLMLATKKRYCRMK
jgi:hypothetical protein